MQKAFLSPSPRGTVSLIILCKASTSKDADFTTEADASEEPSSDIDNKRLQVAHKQSLDKRLR